MAATLDHILKQATDQSALVNRHFRKITDTLSDILWQVAAIRAQGSGQPARGAPPGAAGTPAPPGAGAGTGQIGRQFEAFAGGVARVAAVLLLAERAVTSFGSHLAGFVDKVRPDVVQRWQMAFDDFQGVIGRMLVPVLERVTLLVRRAADALASLSPEAQRFVAGLSAGAGLGSVLAAVGAGIRAVAATVGPLALVLGTVAGAFSGVALSMASGRELAASFGAVLKGLGAVVESLARAVVPAASRALTPVLNTLARTLGAVAETVGRLVAAFAQLAPLLSTLAVGYVGRFAAGLVGLRGVLAGAAAAFVRAGTAVAAAGRLAGIALRSFALGLVLQPVLEALSPLLDRLASALSAVAGAVSDFLDMLGLKRAAEFEVKPDAGLNVARRRAQIETFEGFANRAYTSAATGGMSEDRIPRESLDTLRSIDRSVRELPDRMGDRMRDRGTTDRRSDAESGSRVLGGIAIGAAVGSVVPGLGTAAGGLVGGGLAAMRELFGRFGGR